jgi:tetratricopeptide (TPR) repeat protein
VNATRALSALCLAAALVGCRQADDQRTETVDAEIMRQAREALDPAALAHIDSGNEAYREGRYDASLEHYREATRIEPDAAAAWFGVYMAELALGNAAAAEQALERARAAAPRASLVEPGMGEPPFAGPDAPAPAAPAPDSPAPAAPAPDTAPR